jgi:hypothetical protein
MPPYRITGAGHNMASTDLTSTAVGASNLDLRYTGSRILALGAGSLEIDHINVVNGGTSCGAFIQSTLTNVVLHDNTFIGAHDGTSACDDVWIAGGTNPVSGGLNGTINDYFQGYGSSVHDNFANGIRRLVLGRVAFNAIPIQNNQIWNLSGSNITTAVTAATNATAAVLTSTGHSLFPGQTANLTFSGFTGNWTPLNGAQTVTVIDANTFSVAINSTTFGALTGTPAWLSGAAIEIDGTASSGSSFYDNGNQINGNLIEISGYPFGIKLGYSARNNLSGNSCYDPLTSSIACIWETSNTSLNTVISGYLDLPGMMTAGGQSGTYLSYRSTDQTNLMQVSGASVSDSSPVGNTHFVIQNGAHQSARPFQLSDSAGINVLASIDDTGTFYGTNFTAGYAGGLQGHAVTLYPGSAFTPSWALINSASDFYLISNAETGGGPFTALHCSEIPGYCNFGAYTISAANFPESAHFISQALTCAPTSASGSAYTCNTTPSFTPAMNDQILFQPDVTNSTSTPTLSVNGASANYIFFFNGTSLVPLTTGYFSPGNTATYLLTYRGVWIVESAPPNTGITGSATLVSGTVTVSNSVACTVGASCTYHLTNCGPNASTGIGALSVGTISAGTSFVINSLSSSNTVLTTDASTVCWQIN